MDETKKEAAIILALIFLTLIAVDAAPPGSAIAEGGNITPLSLSVKTLTQRWQGLPGNIIITTPFAPPNVTAYGGNVTETDINLSSPCPNPTITGYIIFSNSSSPPIGLVAGNLVQLDNFVLGTNDSATKTFTLTSTFTINGVTVANVPTTYTYVNQAPQQSKFREGYFNDASGNIVFAVEIYQPTTGYNSSFFEYQALLPVNNKTATLYYLSTDLNIVCPGPGGPGGGGSATRGCMQLWRCTPFGPCINGLQYRNCTSHCGNFTGPPLTRICAQEQAPTEITEKELIEEKHKEKELNITIPRIQAYLGEQFTIKAIVTNPNPFSIEDLSLRIRSQQYYQPLIPLHKNPFYPEMFKTIPFDKLTIETTLTQKPEMMRINPEETFIIPLTATAPIIKPATITSLLEAVTYNMPKGATQVLIDIEARPFKVFSTKTNTKTDLIIVIDNRNQPEQKVNVEIDYNKGRKTKFMELYTLKLPANEVAMYGYTYITPFDYDSIIGRYKSYKVEVR